MGKPKFKAGTKLIEIKREGRHYYGKTKAEAKAKADAYEQAQRQRSEAGDSFEDVATAFWAWKAPKLKYGSVRPYKARLDRAMKWFSGRGIRTITATDINAKLDSMDMAYKSVAGQKSILNMIWRYWCSHMGGDENPVMLLRLPQGLEQTPRLPPTEKEVELIKQHPEGFGVCGAVFMYTGCRLGEVMALQWQDIDFDANSIQITKSCTWHGNAPVIEIPKTKNAVRTIPLVAPLKKILQPLNGNPSDYLFGGEKPLTKRAYENAWLQYCKSLGLIEPTGKVYKTGKCDKEGRPLYKTVQAPRFTAHQLRHEFASVCVECDIAESVAQQILGHADITTTHRWYTYIRSRQIDAAAKSLNAYYGSQ